MQLNPVEPTATPRPARRISNRGSAVALNPPLLKAWRMPRNTEQRPAVDGRQPHDGAGP